MFAVLTVMPVMANAADGDRDENLDKFEVGAVVPSPHFATTSYVRGAFKMAADKIDLLIDDTAVATDGNYIDAGKSVSANLSELDTGLNAVSSTVSGHTTTLNRLTGSGEGSIEQQIEDALSGVSGNAGDLDELDTEEKGSLVGAINEVSDIANDNADAIQTINDKTISYVSDWANQTVTTKKFSELD